MSRYRKRDEDRGPQYGNVIITNNCEQDLQISSVGAWEKGWEDDGDHVRNWTLPVDGQDPETVLHLLNADVSYNEPYREVCWKDAPVIPGTRICESLQREAGNGEVIKITGGAGGTTQMEFTLLQNPDRRDSFPRLDFDVSLLDCGQPDPGQNVTDLDASQDFSLVQKKLDACPGYQQGLVVWFDDNSICRPIYCDSTSYCDAIYLYDRTRKGEMSLACSAEYKGDLHFELCVENSERQSSILDAYNQWSATGTTILSSATDVIITTTPTDVLTMTGTPAPTSFEGSISCSYDPEATLEYCWSELPPATPTCDTVTETAVVTVTAYETDCYGDSTDAPVNEPTATDEPVGEPTSSPSDGSSSEDPTSSTNTDAKTSTAEPTMTKSQEPIPSEDLSDDECNDREPDCSSSASADSVLTSMGTPITVAITTTITLSSDSSSSDTTTSTSSSISSSSSQPSSTSASDTLFYSISTTSAPNSASTAAPSSDASSTSLTTLSSGTVSFSARSSNVSSLSSTSSSIPTSSVS